ncbi:MAG: magnesium chelatase subunit D [Proteobacteria bacterium]|nr:magnesium chelatase subunit D [Pseudomonadota bacterium]
MSAAAHREAEGQQRWDDACRAAAVLALDPLGCGGASVRSGPGAVRRRWLSLLETLLAPEVPLRPVPLHASQASLVGGLDISRTLASGTRVVERGLLASEHTQVLVLSMAERWSDAAVIPITRALDTHEGLLERDGSSLRFRACIGVIALDEGLEDDERPPAALLERLGIQLRLPESVAPSEAESIDTVRAKLLAARSRLRRRAQDPDLIERLARLAEALGIRSIRALLSAARVARCSAALDARLTPDQSDVSFAARLVFAPRATRLPQESGAAEDQEPESPAPDESRDAQPPSADSREQGALEESVVAAARAAIPANLLDSGAGVPRPRRRPSTTSGAGAAQRASQRGRQIGSVAGSPAQGARLDLLATLTAAAPWQRIRKRDLPAAGVVCISRRDFRVRRFEQKSPCTTIFAVDASGSQALHRLAEAKGAVELLLRECYVRRDRVALLAFRGTGAQVLLAPTRSLVRARRCLASLPGGGGTPLAQGIEMAAQLAESLRRGGDTPSLVLLTDGRANITRQGKPDRAQARADTHAAAGRLRRLALATVVVDTSLRPSAEAEAMAQLAGARYVPLPHASAEAIAQVAGAVAAGARR